MSPKRADTGPSMPGAVWLRARPARRGSSGLDREQISATTVALLDRDGTEGLTLRRLAGALDVHATTLYWHVAARDELLDLALDEVFGEVPLPAEHATDRVEDVRGYMHGLRGALLRHPWSGALASSRPLLGPQALARAEFVYAALAAGGFSGTDLAAVGAAVSNFVIGTVASETAWQHDGEAAARTAMSEHLARHAELYPTTAALPVREVDREEHFGRGVDYLLAGLAMR